MEAARDEHPIDPEDVADRDRKLALEVIAAMQEKLDAKDVELDGMQHIMRAMQRDTFRVIADSVARSTPPDVWRALKRGAAYAGVEYETCRYWCERAAIRAEKRGGRWFVEMGSLHAHVASIRGK